MPKRFRPAIGTGFCGSVDFVAGKTLSYLSMKTTVSSKGQIVLPAGIRKRDGIKAGQQFKVERINRGKYRLTRQEPAKNEGLLDWLLSCPEKGWFVPIESESTDTL